MAHTPRSAVNPLALDPSLPGQHPLQPHLPGQPPRHPPVVVTRPEREAAAWVAGLLAEGVPAVALPLMAFGPPADGRALAHAWQHMGGYQALMFVSPQAVHAFFDAQVQLSCPSFCEQKSQFTLVLNELCATPNGVGGVGGVQGADSAPVPTGLRCWAPGPGTANALRLRGVPEVCIDQPMAGATQFDSEALWPVVRGQLRSGFRLLIVRGETEGAAAPGASPQQRQDQGQAQAQGHGRDWLARQCQAAGAEVLFCPAYQRQAPVWTPQQHALGHRLRAGAAVWLISSSESLLHLSRLMPGADWSASPALATHPRIAQAAQAMGFGQVLQSRPTLTDVALALQPGS